MSRFGRHKCLHCMAFFRPDYRVGTRQQYCSKPDCQVRSHKASQVRWLAKNPDYWRGGDAVMRVKQWRLDNPGWRMQRRGKRDRVLQDECQSQRDDNQQETKRDVSRLQDEITSQRFIITGLVGSITGQTGVLQDEIVETMRRMHATGQAILGMKPGMEYQGGRRHADSETSGVSGTSEASAVAVQLGGSSVGAG